VDLRTAGRRNLLPQIVRQDEIYDLAAGVAYHVVMRVHPPVKPVRHAWHGQLADLTDLGEKVEFAVDRWQRDGRQLAADHLEQFVGGRVAVGRPDSLQDELALLGLNHGLGLLSLRMFLVIIFIISGGQLLVNMNFTKISTNYTCSGRSPPSS